MEFEKKKIIDDELKRFQRMERKIKSLTTTLASTQYHKILATTIGNMPLKPFIETIQNHIVETLLEHILPPADISKKVKRHLKMVI